MYDLVKLQKVVDILLELMSNIGNFSSENVSRFDALRLGGR